MAAELTKLVVKVGSASNTLFNSKTSRAYRAITIKELESIVNAQKNIHIVVIEKIRQSEYESIKTFIANFKSIDAQNKVFFYVKDNDDFTCGIADELAYDIHLSLKELHKAIHTHFSINIGTELNKTTLLTGESSEGYDIDYDETFDSSFGEALDTINKTQSAVLVEEVIYELPSIESKDDLGILDESIIEDDIENNSDNLGETDVTTAEKIENIREPEYNQDMDKVIIQLNALNVEKSGMLSQLATALDRIKHLTELVEALDDEKNNYKNLIESLQQSDNIIEEPIGLSEYQGLVSELSTLKSEYNTLKIQLSDRELSSKKLTAELNTLKSASTNLTLKVSSGEISSKKLIEELDTLRRESKDLELKISNGEIDGKKLEAANKNISELLQQILGLKVKLTATEDRAKLEAVGRLKVIKLVDKAVKKISLLNENLDVKVTEVQKISKEAKNLDSKRKENEQTILKLKDEVGNLKIRCREVDRIIATGKAESNVEITKLQIEKLGLQEKIDSVASQLATKEYQYNTMTQAYGIDEHSANTVLDSNKTLEGVNNALREQINIIKNELEQSKKDKIFALQSVRNLDEANRQLKTSLSVISSGLSAGVGVRVPPCNYSGKGLIIPVFGCGSFGVTTTAMSIALKLANEAKVLFIDFDMVMPKADGWFKVNPIIKTVPDFETLGNRSTGLGLLVEKQVQFFLSHAAYIISQPIKNKEGSVDYISGFYSRPDTVKLISADYTSFFNYCGNNYTYVVVDFGRLGSSELNDILIKMVSDIAYRSVAVSTNDLFEARNFSIKMEQSNIDKNNLVWLINMCNSTNIEGTKKYINPASHSVMLFDKDIHGKRVDFTKQKFTRDRLELLMNAIFRK